MRFLYCNNPKISTVDKLWKVRPKIGKIQQNFTNNFVLQWYIDYDKFMKKYFGHHGCKQMLRGKPIRFGYKVWSMYTKEGNLINFELKQGKSVSTNLAHDRHFVGMVENLPKKELPYQFYVACMRTFRENIIPKSCPLLSKDQFQKNKQGRSASIIAKDVGILFVRWKDKTVLQLLAPLYMALTELQMLKDISKPIKKVISAPRPKLIGQYNNYMSGPGGPEYFKIQNSD